MADLKQLARQIFHETLAAIDIPATMQRKLRRQGTRIVCGEKTFDLKEFGKIRVVAMGKAAHAMVDGLVLLLAPFVGFEGVVSAPSLPKKAVPGLKYFAAGHPVPNEDSRRAAEAILALLKKCDEKTLVFFLLSGGGSALVELPLDPKETLEDLQQMYKALVTCGANIDEINTVRKHFSAVKGGRLASSTRSQRFSQSIASAASPQNPAGCASARRNIASYRPVMAHPRARARPLPHLGLKRV